MIKYNENNINEWYFSDDNIVKVYKGLQNTSRLPQGYTEVEYVENTGSSSVNLGIQLMKNANDSFEVVFDNVMTYTSSGGNFQTFITCAREISPYEGWYERFDNNGNVVIAGNLGAATLSSGRTIVSGDVYHTSIGLDSTPSDRVHDYPLNLFSSLDSTKTPWRFCKGKLYNMQVTYNNTLVRDLVPCKNSSNVAGLYDLVNDVFYSSESGYDPLVAGSAVTPSESGGRLVYQKITSGSTPPSPSGLPSGYTEVEYVQNTTQAYINTNLPIYSSTTNSYEVEIKLIAAKHDSEYYQNVFSCMSEDGEPYQGFAYRYSNNVLQGNSIPNGQNTFNIVNNFDSTQTVTITSSSSQRTYTHTYPLTLFCGLDSSRNPFRFTNSKIYSCKITMNGILIMELVPCTRDNDSIAGLYDIVNDVFYSSANANPLVAGPTV